VRAQQIQRRDPRRREGQDADQEQEQVRQIAQNLRERHECEHDSWRYVRGAHACEECGSDLPQYIFECRQCQLQVCNRCRRNRFLI
jgi:hypothetical protein